MRFLEVEWVKTDNLDRHKKKEEGLLSKMSGAAGEVRLLEVSL